MGSLCCSNGNERIMQMPLVSIIVPIYNAEKYLKRCIVSILSQSLIDIEIILVNDCSTDGYLKIAQDFAQADERVHVINCTQNNGKRAQ